MGTVSANSMRRARDKQRAVTQRKSVACYVSGLWNTALDIRDISAEELLDKFVDGPRYQTRLKLLKTGAVSLKIAAQIAMNVDRALFETAKSENFR